MNAVLENIYSRRSIRSFESQPVSREELEQIVKAAVWAPSGMNRQAWHFSVVANQEKIKELAEAIGNALGRDNYDMYRPAAIIITSNEKENHLGEQDCACAMENMMLAAHSLGLGSVWINQGNMSCEDPKVRRIFTELKVPETHKVYGIAAIGYPMAEGEAKERKSGTVSYIF